MRKYDAIADVQISAVFEIIWHADYQTVFWKRVF